MKSKQSIWFISWIGCLPALVIYMTVTHAASSFPENTLLLLLNSCLGLECYALQKLLRWGIRVKQYWLCFLLAVLWHITGNMSRVRTCIPCFVWGKAELTPWAELSWSVLPAAPGDSVYLCTASVQRRKEFNLNCFSEMQCCALCSVMEMCVFALLSVAQKFVKLKMTDKSSSCRNTLLPFLVLKALTNKNEIPCQTVPA